MLAWLRRFGVVGVLSGGLLLIGAPAVSASNGSALCGTFLQQTAAEQDTMAKSGFYSHLDPQAMALCTGDAFATRASFSWVAIEQSTAYCSPSCGNSIVQIGRGSCYEPADSNCVGGPQRLVYAFGRDPGADGCAGLDTILAATHDAGPAPTDTGLHYYRVFHSASAGLWYFDHWPKGQGVTIVATIPDSKICWKEPIGSTFNEVWNSGDAVGGYAANHYNFLSMTRQETVGGSWIPSLGNSCIDDPILSAPYFCHTTPPQAWEGWTAR
jgi:hypothetical protein